jgi:hypothetical protein
VEPGSVDRAKSDRAPVAPYLFFETQEKSLMAQPNRPQRRRSPRWLPDEKTQIALAFISAGIAAMYTLANTKTDSTAAPQAVETTKDNSVSPQVNQVFNLCLGEDDSLCSNEIWLDCGVEIAAYIKRKCIAFDLNNTSATPGARCGWQHYQVACVARQE